jgi:DNA-binding NtrC family response regulator
MQLLLVDDEPNILSSLRRALHAMSSEVFGGALAVECFESPEAALQRAREKAFDLIISDYRMPGMDGATLLETIGAEQPYVAKIILSGYADLAGLMAAINRAQVFRFIAKPWDDAELQIAIRQALENRRLLIENQRLADLVRLQQGKLSRTEHAMKRLEERYPGLTKVKRDADGAIEIDIDDI